MHRSQTYIDDHFLPQNSSTTAVKNTALSGHHANLLNGHLKNDSVGYLISSLISFGDAISAILNNLWTWSTVKLYYSVFYAIRSYLALESHCIFYKGSKPFGLYVQAGSVPEKLEGPTHKVVLDRFSKLYSHHLLLSQDIDLLSPFSWLMSRREEANYKNARFWEPVTPLHFKKIEEYGIRALTKEYCGKDRNLYLFDKDHAILSFPINAIIETVAQMKNVPLIGVSEEDTRYIKSLLRDKVGPVPELHNLI